VGEADGVTVDLRYATADNLAGRPIYSHAVAMLDSRAGALLAHAVRRAASLGLRLRLYDAFRPVEAQWALWHALPDPRFVADPRTGGGSHARGAAVDLALEDARGALPMGTAFDAMEADSAHGAHGLPAEAVRNRALLLGLMVASGWEPYLPEWWHYQVPGSAGWPVLSAADVPDGPMRPGLAQRMGCTNSPPVLTCQEARLGSAQTRQGRAAPRLGATQERPVQGGFPLAEFEAEPQPCLSVTPRGG